MLAVDPSNVKALLRQATAHYWLRRPDEALRVCAAPAAVDPANTGAFEAMRRAARRATLELRGEYDCQGGPFLFHPQLHGSLDALPV